MSSSGGEDSGPSIRATTSAAHYVCLDELSLEEVAEWLKGAERCIALYGDVDLRLALVTALQTIPWSRLCEPLDKKAHRFLKCLERVIFLFVDCTPTLAAAAVQSAFLCLSVLSSSNLVPKELLVRVVNRVAVSQPTYTSTFLHQCISPLYVPRLWPIKRHHEAVLDVLLMLALDPQLPLLPAPSTRRSRREMTTESDATGSTSQTCLPTTCDLSDAQRFESSKGFVLGGNNKCLVHQRDIINLILDKLMEMEVTLESEEHDIQIGPSDILKSCVTKLYDRLSDELKRLRNINSYEQPPWLKDIQAFHLECMTRIHNPLYLHHLAPSLCLHGTSDEVSQLMHKCISVVVKGHMEPRSKTQERGAQQRMAPPARPVAVPSEDRCRAALHLFPLFVFLSGSMPKAMHEATLHRLFKAVSSEFSSSKASKPSMLLVESLFAQGVAIAHTAEVDPEFPIPPVFMEFVLLKHCGMHSSSLLEWINSGAVSIESKLRKVMFDNLALDLPHSKTEDDTLQ